MTESRHFGHGFSEVDAYTGNSANCETGLPDWNYLLIIQSAKIKKRLKELLKFFLSTEIFLRKPV